MDALTAMLEEHRAALSTEFRGAVSTLETKLDSIHSKVEDQEQRIISLDSNVNAVRQRIDTLEASYAALANDNAKLKAKAMNLEGRSRRNNVRIIGLPESIEGPRPTEFFSELLVEVLGGQVLLSPPELDRAHWANLQTFYINNGRANANQDSTMDSTISNDPTDDSFVNIKLQYVGL